MEELIEELLKLGKYEENFESVFKKLKELPRFLAPIVEVPEGTPVERARPISSNEKNYSNISQLGAPPKSTIFGRANFPGQPMFYGAVKAHEEDIPRITILNELSQILRDDLKNITAYEDFVISKWFCTSIIPVCIILPKQFINEKHVLRTYYDSMQNFYNENEDNISSKLINFIGDEFAKFDSNYIITSAFVKYILQKGSKGALYPSVRMKGDGINIALSPNYACKHLQLGAVARIRVYFRDEQVIVDNISATDQFDSSGNFTLEKVTNPKESYGIKRSMMLLASKLYNKGYSYREAYKHCKTGISEFNFRKKL